MNIRRYLPYWSIHPDCVWVRLWMTGPGLQFLHRSHKPYFSERNGYKVFWPAYPKTLWRVGILAPTRVVKR